jgi:signal transduction histidine kinase
MKFRENYFFIILIIFIILSGIAVYNLSQRPALPFSLTSSEQGLSVSQDSSQNVSKIQTSPLVISINGIIVKTFQEVDEIIDRKKIGEHVSIQFTDGQVREAILIPRNTMEYLILNSLLALSFLVISGIVWKYSIEKSDKIFAITALLFGFILAMGWPGIQLVSWISVALVILYFVCYPQAFLSFLYFSYQFPTPTLSESALKRRQWILFPIGFIVSIALIVLFLQKFHDPSSETIERYHGFYRIFRAFILFSLLFSLALFIMNFKKDPTPVNRNKVQWVFGGILWGSFPFIFLWNLPQIFGYNPLIPEWIYVIFLLLTPICVTIAILRHRLFDIEIVLSRSLVYSLVFMSLVIIYLLLIGTVSLLLHDQFSLFRYPFLSIVAAGGLALMINPLRTRIQAMVDQRFFRIRYDRFQMLQEFMQDLDNFTSRNQILGHLSQTFTRSNPLQDELFLIEKSGKWYPMDDVSSPLQSTWDISEEKLSDSLSISEDLSHHVEQELKLPRQKLPNPWILWVPIGKYAIWILGKKRAETRFWKEDIDLIHQLIQAARLQLEKIEYIELSLFEAIQKEQALKQSEWQKLLISEVAHDLRSPLNTILWRLKNFQNELEQGSDPDLQTMEVMKSQIFLLQKHIESLLILSRFEHGTKDIPLHPVSIQLEIDKCLLHLEELLSQKKIELDIRCVENPMILADETILQQIILNLLQNAVKFSPIRAKLKIIGKKDLSENDETMSIFIEDEAGGIPQKILNHAFDPLQVEKYEKGVNESFHLGFYIVNEFTKILGGSIHFSTIEGKGTIVKLTFPTTA